MTRRVSFASLFLCAAACACSQPDTASRSQAGVAGDSVLQARTLESTSLPTVTGDILPIQHRPDSSPWPECFDTRLASGDTVLYSNFEYIGETGDVIGTQLFFYITPDSVWHGFYREAEGAPSHRRSLDDVRFRPDTDSITASFPPPYGMAVGGTLKGRIFCDSVVGIFGAWPASTWHLDERRLSWY